MFITTIHRSDYSYLFLIFWTAVTSMATGSSLAMRHTRCHHCVHGNDDGLVVATAGFKPYLCCECILAFVGRPTSIRDSAYAFDWDCGYTQNLSAFVILCVCPLSPAHIPTLAHRQERMCVYFQFLELFLSFLLVRYDDFYCTFTLLILLFLLLLAYIIIIWI